MFESKIISTQDPELGVLRVVRCPSEEILARAFLMMDQEELLATVWHERVPRLMEFLGMAASEDNVFFACMAGRELAGMGWAVDIKTLKDGIRTCSVGIVFFGAHQTPLYTKAFCSMMIGDLFGPLGMVSLYGFSPVPNRMACLFHRKMGFDVLAILPAYSSWGGDVCDVQVSCMTVDKWNGIAIENKEAEDLDVMLELVES